MAEKYFVFLKNNRVEQVAVFASQDEELADSIAHEQGYDDALWIGEDTPPARWSLYDGLNFTPPTEEYLISIGVIELQNEKPIE